MPLRSITFLLYFLGSSAGAIAFPMLGVVCYIVLYHVYPQTKWWGKSLEVFGFRYSFIVGICLLIGSVLNMNRLRFGRFLHPVETGVFCVFLTILLSIATGDGGWTHGADEVIDKMMKIMIFLFLMTHVVTSRRRLWILAFVFVLMAGQLGIDAKNAPPSAFFKNRLDGVGGPDFRESAALAIHLCALLPFCAIFLLQKKPWVKGIAFFSACYAVNAILLCRARSAFVAAMIVGVAALFYVPRRYRRWTVVLLVLGAIGTVRLSDACFWQRMGTTFSSAEERDGSAAWRLMVWRSSWNMFLQNPLGVGASQFKWEIRKYSTELQWRRRDAHNSYILCVGETGVPGLVAYLATLGLSWYTLSRLSKRVKRTLVDPGFFELLIFANRMALLVYMIAGMFVSRFYTEATWILVVLPVSISRAVQNEIRASVHEEVPELAIANGSAQVTRPFLLPG